MRVLHGFLSEFSEVAAGVKAVSAVHTTPLAPLWRRGRLSFVVTGELLGGVLLDELNTLPLSHKFSPAKCTNQNGAKQPFSYVADRDMDTIDTSTYIYFEVRSCEFSILELSIFL